MWWLFGGLEEELVGLVQFGEPLVGLWDMCGFSLEIDWSMTKVGM